jgi:hypothetical protein
MREALPNVKLICLIEPVPDSNFLLAGHRIWFYDAYQINRPADALEDGIIADCEARRQADENAYYAKSARVSIGGRTFLYHDLTLEKYLDTCNALLPGQLISSNPHCRDYPLRSRMNPANPDAIFDMDHAMVGIPEAHPLWCDKSNYVQKWRDPVLGSLHRRYRMPYDKRFPVVRLTLDQTNLNVPSGTLPAALFISCCRRCLPISSSRMSRRQWIPRLCRISACFGNRFVVAKRLWKWGLQPHHPCLFRVLCRTLKNWTMARIRCPSETFTTRQCPTRARLNLPCPTKSTRMSNGTLTVSPPTTRNALPICKRGEIA